MATRKQQSPKRPAKKARSRKRNSGGKVQRVHVDFGAGAQSILSAARGTVSAAGSAAGTVIDAGKVLHREANKNP